MFCNSNIQSKSNLLHNSDDFTDNSNKTIETIINKQVIINKEYFDTVFYNSNLINSDNSIKNAFNKLYLEFAEIQTNFDIVIQKYMQQQKLIELEEKWFESKIEEFQNEEQENLDFEKKANQIWEDCKKQYLQEDEYLQKK